jgi:hypothetical protein
MKNGRDDHDDEPANDPKITRIEDARRRRQLGLQGKGQAKGGGGRSTGNRFKPGGGSVKEWIIGAVIIAMALGFVVSLAMPLIRTLAH